MQFYYVYVLFSQADGFYIGYTKDLYKRIQEHKVGGARTTRGKDYELIYYEAYQDKTDAAKRERFLKGGSGRKYLRKQLAHYFSEPYRRR